MAADELGLRNTRNLRMRFMVDSGDLSSSDFLSLFDYIDEISKEVVERERQNLLEELGLPSELRLQLLMQTRKLARRSPTPAQVIDISKGSWFVDLLLPAAGILGALTLKSTIFPALTEAFNQSQMRESIIRFLRDSAFRGARKEVESILAEAPSHGQLRVRALNETRDSSLGPELEIKLEVTKIYKVQMSSQDLMDDFVDRLLGR